MCRQLICIRMPQSSRRIALRGKKPEFAGTRLKEAQHKLAIDMTSAPCGSTYGFIAGGKTQKPLNIPLARFFFFNSQLLQESNMFSRTRPRAFAAAAQSTLRPSQVPRTTAAALHTRALPRPNARLEAGATPRALKTGSPAISKRFEHTAADGTRRRFEDFEVCSKLLSATMLHWTDSISIRVA